MASETERYGLCSIDSLNADEEMYGTAPRVDVWLLLEYRGRWSGSAFKDSKIPKAVKSHLNEALKSISDSRLQLIKRRGNNDARLMFYIAVSGEKKPRLYEFELENYEDLLSLDFKKSMKSKKHLCAEKKYIMCTNGEYDMCCGKFGKPVYLDLAKGKYGPRTWETTHIGGHRFASTFVCLPEGVVYGRVREGVFAEKLIDEFEHGKINLSSYRGRSCYPYEAQAAEYYIRKETGITDIPGFIFKNLKKDDKKSVVRFLSPHDNVTHKVKIRQDKNALKIIKSCGEKPSYIPQFRLIES